MPIVIARLVADAALVTVLALTSAGTWNWPRAWILAVTTLVIRIVGAIAVYRVSPALVRERAKLPVHREQPAADKFLVLAVIATGLLGIPIFAGLDLSRWHFLSPPTAIVSSFGLVLFALGWSIKSLALRANAFATSVVRLQRERHHAVADTGVYSVVRHPFYVGTFLVLVGMALWLESYAAALFAVIPISLVVVRITLEERFLVRALPGYDAYSLRVRHRLLPGVW
jgi:protein-S-isoprenylcysteine O-methyltransferase Ste14